jgi:hypothetical protein
MSDEWTGSFGQNGHLAARLEHRAGLYRLQISCLGQGILLHGNFGHCGNPDFGSLEAFVP